MKPCTHGRRLSWLAGIALLAFVPVANAATGVRVLLQAWNPLTPDNQNVVTLVDEPTLVSDSLRDAWQRARPRICEQIKGRMGVGGVAGGQTLYDINCLIDEQAAFDVTGAGQNTLVATFAVGGYIEATSTTPTVLGSYADPRFSVAVKAKLQLTLAIQPSRDETLRVTQVRFTLSDASLDSHNFGGDMLEFVSDDLIPFFGGPNFKHLAEDAVNSVSIDLASRFNTALSPVNAALKGPSDAVRVGVGGNGGYITIAFAARELAPTTTGSMSGVLRWDAARFAPRNGCQSFDIRATVQTGPVPMFTANAEAPTRPLGVFQATPSGASACAFTVSGLAAGWPNFLTARVLNQRAARRAGSSLYRVSFSLAGDGWDGRKVIPQPLATERNYIVARSIDATAIESADFSSKTRIVETRTNPRINPADRYAVHAVPRAAEVVAGSASDGTRLGDTVTLNPQPLPPKSDSVASTGIGQNPGAQSAIIIVGGRTNPLERKSPAAGPVFGTGVSPPVASRVQVQSAQEIDYGALAAKGPQIASQDPLANALRNVQTQGPVRLGFDIGMAVAEGQTASGPGKQRIFESLGAREHGAYEQQGFATAVSFSLQRNANAKLAATGAAIAEADDAAAAVRNAGPDVFYRLGFDIATGIFGDPALGALGNTAKGPGSLGVRKTLSPAGQRGFDDSVAFHLSRKYTH